MNKTVKKGSRISSMRGPFLDIIFYGSLRPMAGTSSNRTDAGVPVLRAPLWSGPERVWWNRRISPGPGQPSDYAVHAIPSGSGKSALPFPASSWPTAYRAAWPWLHDRRGARFPAASVRRSGRSSWSPYNAGRHGPGRRHRGRHYRPLRHRRRACPTYGSVRPSGRGI